MPFILGDEVIKMILTKEEAKRRREKVLKVAFKLFVKNSIEAVSMQQISDASKVGVASVFRYYANKTDLVIAVSAYKAIRFKQKRAVDIIVNTKKEFDIRKDKSASVEREVEEKGVLLY